MALNPIQFFVSVCIELFWKKNREMVSKKHREGAKKHGVGSSSKMRGELPIDNIFCILPKLWPICSPLSTQFKSKRTLRRYWWFVTKYEDIRLCQKHNKKMLPTGHVLWVGQKQMFCHHHHCNPLCVHSMSRKQKKRCIDMYTVHCTMYSLSGWFWIINVFPR